MLERLVASNPSARALGSSPSAALSLAVHGVVIAAAVAATRALPPAGPPPAGWTGEIPIYFADPEPSRAGGGEPLPFPVVDPRTIPTTGDGILTIPVTAPIGIPDPGVSFRVPGTGGTGPSTRPWIPGGGTGEIPSVIPVATADEAPRMLAHPRLEYPGLLREAAIEGTVVLELIVDSTGAAEAGSLRVVSSTHPGFEAAARRALLNAHYRPGRWRGRPVRVLIRQAVEFRLAS